VVWEWAWRFAGRLSRHITDAYGLHQISRRAPSFSLSFEPRRGCNSVEGTILFSQKADGTWDDLGKTLPTCLRSSIPLIARARANGRCSSPLPKKPPYEVTAKRFSAGFDLHVAKPADVKALAEFVILGITI
jgi:hypothetical protein